MVFNFGTDTRHGLVMCKTCNSSLNIHRIVTETLAGNGRPNYLSRGKASLSGAASASRKNKTRGGGQVEKRSLPRNTRGCESSTL